MTILRTLLNVGSVIMNTLLVICHITGKDRSSAHRERNMNQELDHKNLVVFNNLKYYDSHLIISELGINSILK